MEGVALWQACRDSEDAYVRALLAVAGWRERSRWERRWALRRAGSARTFVDLGELLRRRDAARSEFEVWLVAQCR